jgi:prolyl-tRNA editing enzyme YbaK/EbsC (Cys-tRNA(Pro) deacylase)
MDQVPCLYGHASDHRSHTGRHVRMDAPAALDVSGKDNGGDMELSASAQRVQQTLNNRGVKLQVVELPASTRTAVEAAQAVGCDVGQIIKSIVFKGKRSERPILVIASGKNRVDEKRIEELIGEPLGKADADFVRQRTGYVIGGVPPVGHTERILTFIDEDLFQYELLWAAAGTPNAVFQLSPQDLSALADGTVTRIRQT